MEMTFTEQMFHTFGWNSVTRYGLHYYICFSLLLISHVTLNLINYA